MITHFLRFADASAAQTALATWWCTPGSCWFSDKADGGFAVYKPDGSSVGANPSLVTGYHVNIALPTLSGVLAALSEFIGAMDDSGASVSGGGPTWPKRVFAGTAMTQSSPLLDQSGASILTNGDQVVETTL